VHAVRVAVRHLFRYQGLGTPVGCIAVRSPRTTDRYAGPASMARGSSSSSPLDGSAPPFEMPGTSRVTDAPPAGDPGTLRALGAVALVGGGRAVQAGGGGTVAGASNSPPEDPGRTPTTGARPPPGAGRRSTLAESQRGGAGAHPSPLDGQRPEVAPPSCPPRVAAVGSSSGAPAGGIPTGPGSSRSVDALSLEEEERQRRDLQRAFGVTPDEVTRAQWQRSTRDHWSLDPPSAVGGPGPSLHGVSGGATHGLSRPVADTVRLRQVVQVFRDAADEASTAALNGTPAPGRSAAVASALAATQLPSSLSASAGDTAAPGPGSDTHGKSSRAAEGTGVAPALDVAATRYERSPPSRLRQAPTARTPRDGARLEQRRRRSSRRDKSPPSSRLSSSTESEHSPPGSSSDPSGTDSTKSSRSSTSTADSGSDRGAPRRRRRARAAEKRPQGALVQEALRASRREQREDTVVDPRFKGLLSLAQYRLALRGGRFHLPRGNSIRGIRADVRALMHTSRPFAGDTPLGLVTLLGNFQTACDGSGLNEGTAVTVLQYFVTSEVLGVLQRAKDTHTTRQLTYKRAVRALLNEYLDGDVLVDHLQSLMQATQEKWEDEHEFSNRILDANRALGSVLREAELKSILLKSVGREVRALGRNFNTQGRTLPKLRKFLEKTGAATREARGVRLQAKPTGSNSRCSGGKEREPRRSRTAA